MALVDGSTEHLPNFGRLSERPKGVSHAQRQKSLHMEEWRGMFSSWRGRSLRRRRSRFVWKQGTPDFSGSSIIFPFIKEALFCALFPDWPKWLSVKIHSTEMAEGASQRTHVPHVLRPYTEGEADLKGSCLVMLSKTGRFSSKRGQIFFGGELTAQLWTDDPCDVHPHGGCGLQHGCRSRLMSCSFGFPEHHHHIIFPQQFTPTATANTSLAPPLLHHLRLHITYASVHHLRFKN